MTARKKASKRPAKRRSGKSNSDPISLLAELGRQTLVEGVKEVLAENGIDGNVEVKVLLAAPKRKTAKKTARKASGRPRRTTRRY